MSASARTNTGGLASDCRLSDSAGREMMPPQTSVLQSELFSLLLFTGSPVIK